MAVIAYQKINEGTGIYIKSDPVIGIIALTAFTESLSGVTISSYFVSKVFRYSLDGINFSEWIELTVPNITSLSFNSTDIVILELQYVKNNPDPNLDVNNVSFTETTSPTGFDETYFSNSIFSEFFGSADLEVLKWYVNVVEKLYQKELLPSFIDRSNQQRGDKDFIEFWQAIAKYFGFLVIYARKYEKFYESESLLSEYLEQRGMKTSRENDLVELNYLMETFYHQVFNRGTIHIVDDKVLKGDEIDGELLRLIFYKPTNEFLFNLHKIEHFGWNLGNSSPLWRGLYLNESLQKVTASSQLVKVSPSLGYEISFWVETENPISLVVQAFDINGDPVQLKSSIDGSLTNTALDSITLMRSDKSIFVRVLLLPKDRLPYSGDVTTLNQGCNLIMVDNCISIRPVFYNDGVETILLPNVDKFRVAPLFTNFSHGILQVYNWITCWLQNNNHNFSKSQIKQYIRKYLIPYNSHLELIDIPAGLWEGGQEETTTTTTEMLYGWRGVDPSCVYEEDGTGKQFYNMLQQYQLSNPRIVIGYVPNTVEHPEYIPPFESENCQNIDNDICCAERYVTGYHQVSFVENSPTTHQLTIPTLTSTIEKSVDMNFVEVDVEWKLFSKGVLLDSGDFLNQSLPFVQNFDKTVNTEGSCLLLQFQYKFTSTVDGATIYLTTSLIITFHPSGVITNILQCNGLITEFQLCKVLKFFFATGFSGSTSPFLSNKIYVSEQIINYSMLGYPDTNLALPYDVNILTQSSSLSNEYLEEHIPNDILSYWFDLIDPTLLNIKPLTSVVVLTECFSTFCNEDSILTEDFECILTEDEEAIIEE